MEEVRKFLQAISTDPKAKELMKGMKEPKKGKHRLQFLGMRQRILCRHLRGKMRLDVLGAGRGYGLVIHPGAGRTTAHDPRQRKIPGITPGILYSWTEGRFLCPSLCPRSTGLIDENFVGRRPLDLQIFQFLVLVGLEGIRILRTVIIGDHKAA